MTRCSNRCWKWSHTLLHCAADNYFKAALCFLWNLSESTAQKSDMASDRVIVYFTKTNYSLPQNVRMSASGLLAAWVVPPAGWKKCIHSHDLNIPKMVTKIVHCNPLNLLNLKRWVALCILHWQHTILQFWCHISVLRVLVWERPVTIVLCI